MTACLDGNGEHDDHHDAYMRYPVPIEALNRIRDAVAGAQSRGVRLANGEEVTMTWVFHRGLELVQRELETYFNSGASFPARTGELPRGRPRRG